MALRLIISAVFLGFWSAALSAGAWPREKGHGFFSTAVRVGWPQDVSQMSSVNPTEQYYTLYLEYGITDRLTFGLDLGRSVSGAGKTVGFLQWPLRNSERGPKMALALGLGKIGEQTVVRPGVSVGWGLKKGWVTLDSLAEFQVESGLVDYKMDITWGRNLKNDRKLLVQVQTGQPAEDPAFVRLAPSYVFPIGKRGMMVETGVTYGVTGDESMGLKLGIWRNF